ncbi:MAG: 16S rRNA (adenine(1518)-N(6)/adenine(1519)-N(6))-dimethyltransferase RsmA, partial [Chloroflexi bacterium]|nr:16S rRNA (adenine(1518)-N(6)/adenine(1519)-N(6))-dimethyltransferase RsmA [Chloroflexota bacterium]
MSAGAPRLDPLEVRRTLRRAGLRASHARSQNFLADPDVLQSILDLAEVSPGSRVLEIGPGL